MPGNPNRNMCATLPCFQNDDREEIPKCQPANADDTGSCQRLLQTDLPQTVIKYPATHICSRANNSRARCGLRYIKICYSNLPCILSFICNQSEKYGNRSPHKVCDTNQPIVTPVITLPVLKSNLSVIHVIHFHKIQLIITIS